MLVGLCKRAFYRAANAIFGKVSWAAFEEVVLQLIKSKCYPVLLYGLEANVLNNVDKNSIDYTAKRFFMKLFRTVNSEIITDCQTFFGIDSPSVRLSKLTVQFVARYNTSDNYICNLFYVTTTLSYNYFSQPLFCFWFSMFVFVLFWCVCVCSLAITSVMK